MKYPIDVEKYVETWLSVQAAPDNADRAVAVATAEAINRAYYAGLEAGRKEK